jgi:hypothetical protein
MGVVAKEMGGRQHTSTPDNKKKQGAVAQITTMSEPVQSQRNKRFPGLEAKTTTNE